jgi:hypothetical protein
VKRVKHNLMTLLLMTSQPPVKGEQKKIRVIKYHFFIQTAEK